MCMCVKTYVQVSQGKVNRKKKKKLFKIDLQWEESFLMDPKCYSWCTCRYTKLFPVLDDKVKLLISCNICEEERETVEEIGAVRL